MTFSIQTKEKVVAMSITILIFITLTLYLSVGFASAQGIPDQQASNYQRVNLVSNKGLSINLASNLRLEENATVMQSNINSPFAELKPALTPSGDRLYFSRSYHPQNTFGELDAEDIWYSNFDVQNNSWSDPVRIPGFLNNSGPNFINTVSITGDTIVLGNQYGRKGKMYSGLSYSVNIAGQWSTPTAIDIEYDYNMSPHANAFVSLKDGIIILAVQRLESTGERDLYVSFWDGDNATVPMNMGSMINTSLEESSPFLAADNKTLYFASKGHAGFGGMDIFVTRRLDESWTNWSTPENLGQAVNSVHNEEFFTISHSGSKAMFSRNVTVHNSDIFEIATTDLFTNASPVVIPASLKKALAIF